MRREKIVLDDYESPGACGAQSAQAVDSPIIIGREDDRGQHRVSDLALDPGVLVEIRPRCDLCRFYKPAPEEIDVTPHGDCRRHAPTANPARKNAGEWPQVAARAWCGDFAAAVDRMPDPEGV